MRDMRPSLRCSVQVLQKAVDVALAVLRDIEDFSESLRGRELSVARGESPAADATPAAAARKLRHLISAWETLPAFIPRPRAGG